MNTTSVVSSTPLPENPGTDEVVYIDGFNAYNGMRNAGLDNCRWLNWAAYAATLVTSTDYIVRYFTAVVNVPPDARNRQLLYLRALRAHGGLDIIEGSFMARKMKCPNCGHRWNRPKEQYTDVNIAIAMTHDALLHVDSLQWRKNQLPNPVTETYRGGRKQRSLTAPDNWT